MEELRLVEGPLSGGILARSDQRKFRCGAGLTEDDRRYLRSIVLKRLRGL